MNWMFRCSGAKMARSALYVLGLAAGAFAITPNPNLSIGKSLYVGGAVNTNWKPEVYTDGHLDFNQVASATDFALNVGEGPTKLFITWETRGDEAWVGDQYVHAASCQHNPTAGSNLQNFKVMTSANSTNGTDGDWETVAEVGESGAMSRGLAIDFAGKSWFRIVADEAVKNLEEVGAYDMSNGGNDTWFFMGTSISQMGIKQMEVDSSFSQLIHARYPDYYPVMLRGGIGCVTSSGVVEGLKYYGEYVGNVKFWAIEMGTNDAWGGYDTKVETFKTNMQEIIDTAKAHGVTPVIARMIATNPEVAKWQVNEAYLTAIDELTASNNLPAGPDFFDYFSKHPEELSTSDGVHPAEKGAASMHRLWAEAMAPLYEDESGKYDGSADKDPVAGKDSTAVGDSTGVKDPAAIKAPLSLRFSMPRINVDGRSIHVSGVDAGATVSIVSSMGQVVNGAQLAPGNYMVVIRGQGQSMTARVTIK